MSRRTHWNYRNVYPILVGITRKKSEHYRTVMKIEIGFPASSKQVPVHALRPLSRYQQKHRRVYAPYDLVPSSRRLAPSHRSAPKVSIGTDQLSEPQASRISQGHRKNRLNHRRAADVTERSTSSPHHGSPFILIPPSRDRFADGSTDLASRT